MIANFIKFAILFQSGIFCYGQSVTTTELPLAQLIDVGFRLKVINEQAKQVFTVGEKIKEIKETTGITCRALEPVIHQFTNFYQTRWRKE
ncbi:hypothetical protein JW935_14415 [candidate division KSB1 bacterium]|nr:hypothetical protein [candidate division KSB1 bacterium]